MKLTDKLTLNSALFQAPLTGYPKQDEFVVAVSNQGALGIYSTEMQTLDEIKKNLLSLNKHCKAPFAVLIDLAESETDINVAERKSANHYLKPAYHTLQIAEKEAPAFPDVNAVCKAVVEKKPPVLIFQNGLPSDAFIEHCQRGGIAMLAIAGNTLEAIAIENTTIDGIILQGLESAGSQSTFENDLPTERFPISTLLHYVKQNTTKPLVIWGDCQTPGSASRLLKQGASGVILDVPLWTSKESPIPDSYRQALNEHNEMLTTVTHVWQGQATRVLQNALTRQVGSKKTLLPGKQQRLLSPIISAAIAQDNADYLPLWAGLCAVSSEGKSLAEICQAYNKVINTIELI